MRKLYVPIMMDPEHSLAQYDEDFKKLGADTVFFGGKHEICPFERQTLRACHGNCKKHDRGLRIARL